MTLALAGVSLPIFWTGLVSLAFFSYQLGWTPPGASYTPFTENPLEVGARPVAAVDHAGVPVLGAVRPAHPGRHARDHGRGLHPHGPRQGTAGADRRSSSTGCESALTPIVTIFGLDFGLLIGGAVLTETVFGLPGLGQLAIKAPRTNDLPQVLAVVLITAVFVAVCNLIVDLLYAVIDPRVRTR